MKTKTTYLFDAVTGALIGLWDAQESPMEPGVFITPDHSTDVAPPVAGPNEIPVFSAGAWSLQPDYRGHIMYDQTSGAEQGVPSIGPIPAGFALTPPPPAPPTQAELIGMYETAVQAWLDGTAKAKGYDTALSCATYQTSANATFAAEAKAMIAWRDAVWGACYTDLAAIQAGTMAMPVSPQAFITSLPQPVTFGWI